jgi:hypothetical protein
VLPTAAPQARNLSQVRIATDIDYPQALNRTSPLLDTYDETDIASLLRFAQEPQASRMLVVAAVKECSDPTSKVRSV